MRPERLVYRKTNLNSFRYYQSTPTMSAEPSPFLNGVTDNLVKNTSFGQPKINTATNAKSIPIYNSLARKILSVRMPQLTTWGAEEKEFEPGKKKYSLTLQLPSSEYMTPETIALLKNLKEFEDEIKRLAGTDCAMDWFKKPSILPAVVDALFVPMLRYPKIEGSSEPNYAKPPTLNIKIPMWDGVFKCEVFNLEGQLLFPNNTGVPITDLIPKSSQISLIMQCGGIWFAGGKFGVTWKLFQAAVRQKTQLARGVCHVFDSASVASPEPPSSKPEPEAVQSNDSLMVNDSEDEDADTEYNAVVETESAPPVKGEIKVKKAKTKK
jgi:hypothetical protein